MDMNIPSDASAVRLFFDERAQGWDDCCHHNKKGIARILDLAEIHQGDTVLDIACGTGVMVPYYIERGAAHIYGLDLSPRMIEQARKKHPETNVEFMVGDAESVPLPLSNGAVIYNAWPHFCNPQRLVAHLAQALTPQGRLTVAHGESREKINGHHKSAAEQVSDKLMPAQDLALMLSPWFKIDVILDEDVYAVSGVKQ